MLYKRAAPSFFLPSCLEFSTSHISLTIHFRTMKYMYEKIIVFYNIIEMCKLGNSGPTRFFWLIIYKFEIIRTLNDQLYGTLLDNLAAKWKLKWNLGIKIFRLFTTSSQAEGRVTLLVTYIFVFYIIFIISLYIFK